MGARVRGLYMAGQAMADGSFPSECAAPDSIINVAFFASAPWAKSDMLAAL